MGWVGLGRAQPGSDCARAGRGASPGAAGRRAALRQHPVLRFRDRPVHALLDVLLHAEPVLVADLDAAVAPLVVARPLLRIAQDLLRLLLQGEKQKH